MPRCTSISLMKKLSSRSSQPPMRHSWCRSSGTKTAHRPRGISLQRLVRRDSAASARGAPRWRASCRRNSTKGALVLGAHVREAHPSEAHPHHNKGVAVVVHGRVAIVAKRRPSARSHENAAGEENKCGSFGSRSSLQSLSGVRFWRPARICMHRRYELLIPPSPRSAAVILKRR